ncbi:hypothetical protein ABFX02_08G126600 [Erythranthe guttata]
MKRNCNLDLRLVTPSLPPPSMVNWNNRNDTQELTIFYNGRVAVCDATELQARAIIWVASHAVVEDKTNGSPGSDPVSSPLLSPSMYSPSSVVSMKRSLKMFLQKRKTRSQATSPYPVITTKYSSQNWRPTSN